MLTLLSQDGFNFEKVSSSNGGVYKGPCPWCGGDDRFTVYPDDGYGGGYICNQCSQKGDKIAYLRNYRGLSYTEACVELNITPKMTFESSRDLINKKNKIHTPNIIQNPPGKWTEKSTDLLFQWFKNLMSPAGKIQRDYLIFNKYLTIETIKKARLGYNKTGLKYSKESFGLDPDPEKNTAWIAAGIIIPYFENGNLVRLRSRQEDYNPKFGKYIMSTGSSSTYFIYPDFEPFIKPALVIESELDGWLIWQECKDLVNVVATGSSNNYTCEKSDYSIKNCSGVYVWGDNDKAGQKMNEWWVKNYSATPIYTSIGDDVSEAAKNGLELRRFILDQINPENTDKTILEERSNKVDDISINFGEVSPTKPKKEEKILEQKEVNSQENNKNSQENKKFQNRDCYNTGFCGRLKDEVCLLTKKSLHDMDKCPAEPSVWKRWKDPSGCFEQIIIQPRLNRSKF